MNILWFKRDLRIEDNEALIGAFRSGHVMPLYILEPELWKLPDMSHRQYVFLMESLHELDGSLRARGQGLIIKIGNAVDVLSDLHARYTIKSLWSHQETWNGWTYARDKAVKQWTKQTGIPWFEPAQHGVIRRLQDRNGWAAAWDKRMRHPVLMPDKEISPIDEPSDTLPSPIELGLREDGCIFAQKGGRSEGLKALRSFLYERGEGYTKEMSSPVTAFESCSRLSPHLAFGTLSMREVFHATEARALELSQMPYSTKGRWPSAIRSFSGRLRWHCHFMQKLEDEPRIEFKNMHPAYDGLRENDFNAEHFEAWKAGKTGYPMIDACMRALTATGWLNFRMRAMLMSFASYHLWLHWRRPALHLAQMFIDYEPGIHYSQAQMQSGTTGINSIRIYNPIKQGMDHDPEGVFIRRWIPELSQIDQKYIHTPWKNPSAMNGYPMPIIDEKLARKTAAERLYGLRKDSAHKIIARDIVSKHGRRKSGLPKTTDQKPKKTKPNNPQQIELPL